MFLIRSLLLILSFTLITGCQTAPNKDPRPKTLLSEQRVEVNTFNLYKANGHRAIKQNRLGDALKYFLKAEEIDGNNIELLGLIGVTLRHLSAHKDAIQYFEKIIKLNPDDYRAYSNIASLYKEKGSFTQAKAFYRKVLNLKYNDKGAVVNLADISFKTNQYDNTLNYILMFTDLINKENASLLTDKERLRIRKTLERFDHYKTIIYNKSNSNKVINEEKPSEYKKDKWSF